MWIHLHSALHSVCVYLWTDANQCRTMVREAGIDSSQMSFDEPNALRWESVIRECEKQESLTLLCPVLLARFPNNKRLQAAVAPWMNGSLQVAIEEATVIEKAISKEASDKKKVLGTSVAVKLVPVYVPEELAEDASVALIATIASLRITVGEQQREINKLMAWRDSISTLSRSEVDERTGGNEPGENRPDPLVPAPT